MKIILLVIDGLGIGAMPDAAAFSDVGANTLKHVTEQTFVKLPTLTEWGLYAAAGLSTQKGSGAYGKMQELSLAKDTTVGHWEMAGVVTLRPFPTYPKGFPARIVHGLEKIFGTKILLNRPYSGTDALRDYGQKHLQTKCPIVYTSADSVLQIAVHTDVMSTAELYRKCEEVRNLMQGEDAVGRVIARPFAGTCPNYYRTEGRKDFALAPPKNLLDELSANGIPVIGIGKIEDIFAHRGLTESYHTQNNQDGLTKTAEVCRKTKDGFVFVNLVDTDSLYGHRRDVIGYAKSLSATDSALKDLRRLLRPEDVLMITGDHGCDPTFSAHTDHTREQTPLLIVGDAVVPTDLGELQGFDTIADTVREAFGMPQNGKSVWKKITTSHA